MKSIKIKKIVLATIFVCACSFLFAERLARLPEVMKPFYITADGNRLYVTENSSVSMYSMKSFKFIKRFGEKGEGPGQFKTFPVPEVFPNHLIINCFGKLMFFSLNGDFIKENRIQIFEHFIAPVGKNFVGLKIHRNRKTGMSSHTIVLFDKEMKPIKEIAGGHERNVNKGKTSGKIRDEVIRDYFRHQVYGDRIYVGDTGKGFFIEVFDGNGNKLYEINKKYEKLNVTDEYKKGYLMRKNRSGDIIDKMTKGRMKYVFRDYFPAFDFFTVKDEKIYVFTYKTRGKKREVIVMDLKGNILKRVFVTPVYTNFHTIANGKYYYLKDNVAEEVWELYGEDIPILSECSLPMRKK